MAYDGVDWDGKERRIIRQNSNTNATAIVTAMIERGLITKADTIEQDLKIYSEFFEGLVYKGFEEKKG